MRGNGRNRILNRFSLLFRPVKRRSCFQKGPHPLLMCEAYHSSRSIAAELFRLVVGSSSVGELFDFSLS